jgi:serine/threonine protein kinase
MKDIQKPRLFNSNPASLSDVTVSDSLQADNPDVNAAIKDDCFDFFEDRISEYLRDGTYLKYEDLTLGPELGRGGFGVVYKGSVHETPVAIKQLIISISDKACFYNELQVMRRVRHPNCVLFLGATMPPDPMCIVTEYIEKGNLQELIYNKNEVLNKTRILKYILDIARGMNYLHHNGIIHLDLTPANVLVTESYVCKVADFGLSKISEAYTKSITNRGGGTIFYTVLVYLLSLFF